MHALGPARLGLLVAGIGALTWVAAGIHYDLDVMSWFGTLLIAGGLLWASRMEPRASAVSWPTGTATVGMLLFVVSVRPGASLGGLASIAFLSGLAVSSIGAFTDRTVILRSGLGIAGAASMLWVLTDLVASAHAWQPGNILAAFGLLLAGRAPWGGSDR